MADEAASRILLVGGSEISADSLISTMRAGRGGAWDLERAESIEAALLSLCRGAVDIILLDLDAFADSLVAVRRLREAAPTVPLIALSGACDDDQSVAVLHAGAEDCVPLEPLGDPAMRRAIRNALERSRFQTRLDERREFAAREREFGGLAALGGPAALPVTGRSFGVVPLIERGPQHFGDLVIRYTALLDLAIEERTVRVESRLGEELSGFADRIGLLGGGPRDLIDIHKAAITSRLEGQSLRRARAYVEEGRLLLLQVMGYLVTFYRNLSWGRGASARSSMVSDETGALGESITGKGWP